MSSFSRNVVLGLLLGGQGLVVMSQEQVSPPPATPQMISLYSRQILSLLVPGFRLQTGENAFSISDYFCEFAIWSPEVFLEEMERNPQEYSYWLARLPDVSFTDYGGCAVERECIRTAMVKSVERAAETDSAHRAQFKALAARLKEIKVRKVS